MSDIVERLLEPDWHDPACPFKMHCYCDDGAPHDKVSHPLALEAASTITALRERVKVLEADGFKLSAGQCINPGGHGLKLGEGGNPYCSAHEALEALRAELAAAEAREARLREEIAKLSWPEWFYDADGEMETADCSVEEVVESVLEWHCEPGDYHKPRLIEVATAKPLPSIWVIARAYTDEEKNEHDDEPYDIREFSTEAEARAALQEADDGR